MCSIFLIGYNNTKMGFTLWVFTTQIATTLAYITGYPDLVVVVMNYGLNELSWILMNL